MASLFLSFNFVHFSFIFIPEHKFTCYKLNPFSLLFIFFIIFKEGFWKSTSSLCIFLNKMHKYISSMTANPDFRVLKNKREMCRTNKLIFSSTALPVRSKKNSSDFELCTAELFKKVTSRFPYDFYIMGKLRFSRLGRRGKFFMDFSKIEINVFFRIKKI